MDGEKEGLLLDLRSISKAFGGAKALDRVDFQLRAGEVLGLVGENGAGKSTLMKILAGVHTRYEGEMWLRGQAVRFSSPRSARAHGISMIYQELSSVGALSVAENLFLAEAPYRRCGILNWGELRRRAEALLAELGINIDVQAPFDDLPLGLQQIIEIARVTHGGGDILIMDEPTSALSPSEVQQFFRIVRRLKDMGKSIIFISHFLDDVMAICDRITVLRNGKGVATLVAADSSKHDMIRYMLGDEAHMLEEGHEGVFLRSDNTRPKVLEVTGGNRGTRLIDADLFVREGEILGLYGALGAGHTLIAECIYGLKPLDEGRIVLDGKPLKHFRPYTAKSRGIAYVSSDRRTSLFPESEIYKNITITFLKSLMPLLLNAKAEIGISDAMIQRLGVKARSSLVALRTLSGGNQQKVALARWLVRPIRLLILNEPTRGMDVAAKEEVIRIVRDLKQGPTSVLLVSSEPETLIASCDRILVFSKGRIVAEFAEQAVTKETIMRCV